MMHAARFLEAQVRKELARWLKRSGMGLLPETIKVRLIQVDSGVTRRPDPASGDLKEPVTAFRRARARARA